MPATRDVLEQTAGQFDTAPALASSDPAGASHIAEAVEAAGWSDMMRACPPGLAAGLGLEVIDDGAAATSIAGRIPVAMFNRSFGWLTEDAWAAALRRHRASGATDFFLQPPPYIDPAFDRWVRGAGLVRRSRWAKMVRGRERLPEAATHLRITAAGPQFADAFASVTLGGFGLPPSFAPWLVALAGRPGWRTYVGWDGDIAVSAAALRIAGEAAWCGLAATLPDHRGRGGQNAMFARRIGEALDAGCRVIVTETGEDTPHAPNPSYRNMIRAGFRLAHYRDNWAPTARPPG